MTRSLSLRRFGAVLALLLMAWASPVLAQNAAKADVEKLVSTLEDPTARKQLVGQLKLLLKAQNADVAAQALADAQPMPGAALLSAIPDRIEDSLWTALRRWGGGAAAFLSKGIGPRLIGGVISIGSILILAWVVWRVVSGGIQRYLDGRDREGNLVARSQRMRTLLPLLRLVVRVVLTVMVTLIVLSELGVNIAPLLAGAGVVGIAVGFGAQKLVQDIITGIFILVEDTISVGDIVSIAPYSGVVESMSIRALKLRDMSGNLHTVPFSSVDGVTNMSKDFANAVFDVGVAYREDVDHVITVLTDLGNEFMADAVWGAKLLRPLEVLGLDRFDASAVVIRVRYRTLPAEQWSVMREFNRRMKRRFDELGIEIPFPQTTVWFGEDRDGKAPLVRVQPA